MQSVKNDMINMQLGDTRKASTTLAVASFHVANIPVGDIMKLKDLTGQRFGRLLVISRAENAGKQTRWNCICDCGVKTKSHAHSLKTGRSTSCGCYNKEKAITHGKCYSGEYCSWHHMIQRCTNKNISTYKYYGGRGVSVCESWLNSFANFYADMGDRPEGLTIERINNENGYSPKNCKWATRADQTRNRRKYGEC